MTSQEIEDLLVKEQKWGSGMDPKLTHVEILDRTYALPTREWVFKTFPKFLKNQLFNLPYVVDKWDCNSFAFFAFAMAKACHAQVGKYKGEDGLAFGTVGYFRMVEWPMGQHAINFAIVRDQDEKTGEFGERKVVFFEPQNNTELTLYPAELESIRFALI